MTARMTDELNERAACRGLSSAARDPWHPAGKEAPTLYAEAKRVCLACPVLDLCTEYALGLLETTGQVEGMYGGRTPQEIRKYARSLGRPARKAAQHGTRARYVGWKCKCGPCRAANARYKAGLERAS